MGFWSNLFGSNKEETETTEDSNTEMFKCTECDAEHSSQEEANNCCEKTYNYTITSEVEVEVSAYNKEEADEKIEDFDAYGQELWNESEATFIEPVEEETEEEPVEEEAEEEPVEEVPKKQNKKKNK